MDQRMQMREPEMDRMVEILIQSAAQFREVQGQMVALARMVEGGALVGQAGTALEQALGGTITASIERLATKLEERAKYVEKEKTELKIAMAQSGSQYGS
jgi:DNA-binding FrmR family transcriptional regulator